MDRLLLRDGGTLSFDQKPDVNTSKFRQSLSFDKARRNANALPDIQRVSLLDDDDWVMHYTTRSHRSNSENSSRSADSAASNASEYVAVLTADMIPEPQWLRAMLPHIIEESRIAMISPPLVSLTQVIPDAG